MINVVEIQYLLDLINNMELLPRNDNVNIIIASSNAQPLT